MGRFFLRRTRSFLVVELCLVLILSSVLAFGMENEERIDTNNSNTDRRPYVIDEDEMMVLRHDAPVVIAGEVDDEDDDDDDDDDFGHEDWENERILLHGRELASKGCRVKKVQHCTRSCNKLPSGRVNSDCFLGQSTVPSVSQCKKNCFRNNKCFSYEFIGDTKGKFTCALYSCYEAGGSKWSSFSFLDTFQVFRVRNCKPNRKPTYTSSQGVTKTPTKVPTLVPTQRPIKSTKMPTARPTEVPTPAPVDPNAHCYDRVISKRTGTFPKTGRRLDEYRRDLQNGNGQLLNPKSAADSMGLSSASGTRPNIIFVFVDDLGIGDIGVSQFGPTNKINQLVTPNLQKLADGGISFTKAYSPNSVCLPSRYSLLVGKHAGHGQIRGNGGIKEDIPFLESEVTISMLLKDRGYNTAVIGKWGLGDHSERSHPHDKGFDYFLGQITHKDAHACFPTYIHNSRIEKPDYHNTFYLPKNEEASEKRCKKKEFDDPDTCDFVHDVYTTGAVDYIKENANPKGKPFFLLLSYTIPHVCSWTKSSTDPQVKAAPYFDRACLDTLVLDRSDSDTPTLKEECRHKAMVENYLDHDVGRIVQTLRDRDVFDNTLLIFAGDNGPERVLLKKGHPSWEPGANVLHAVSTFQSTNGLRGLKRELFEGSLRTPFIFHWPRAIKSPGRVSTLPTTLIDLFATLADAAGVPKDRIPDNLDTVSLLPTLSNQISSQRQHAHLYFEYCERQLANWKQIRSNPDTYCSWSVQQDGFKLIYDWERGKKFLFDLQTDPYEQRNLWVDPDGPDPVSSSDLYGYRTSDLLMQQDDLLCERKVEAYMSLSDAGFSPRE